MRLLISGLFVILLGWAILAPLAIPVAWRMLRLRGGSGWPALSLLLPYVGMVAVLVLLGTPRAPERRVAMPAALARP
jgi:hypothetical protein